MRSLLVSALFLSALPATASASDLTMKYGGPLCPTYTSASDADDLFVATHDVEHTLAACITVDAGTKLQAIDSVDRSLGYTYKVFYKGAFWWTTSRFAYEG